jgi:hypothetical protein
MLEHFGRLTAVSDLQDANANAPKDVQLGKLVVASFEQLKNAYEYTVVAFGNDAAASDEHP